VSADVLELRALVDRYAAAVDDLDADGFVALFLPEAVLDIYAPGADEPAAVYRGADELRGVFDLLARFERTHHMMGNHLCELDGDAGTGHVHCIARHLRRHEGEERDLVMVIRYRDAYRRTPEGWRFAERQVRLQWTEDHPASTGPSF
jgi:3-phenylpropionate/cinnamic acid dioxygenase small subunit